MGALRLFLMFFMRKRTRYLVHGAVIASLYVVLTHLQNLILPGSASWALQVRLAEALTVLAFFSPAAAQGLAMGCLVFNLTSAAALPLDYLVGTLATYLAAKGMWLTRKWTVWGLPAVGLFLPALFNGLLVGWELTVYLGGGFRFNALSVAAGETIALLTLGIALYAAIKTRGLDVRLFG